MKLSFPSFAFLALAPAAVVAACSGDTFTASPAASAGAANGGSTAMAGSSPGSGAGGGSGNGGAGAAGTSAGGSGANGGNAGSTTGAGSAGTSSGGGASGDGGKAGGAGQSGSGGAAGGGGAGQGSASGASTGGQGGTSGAGTGGQGGTSGAGTGGQGGAAGSGTGGLGGGAGAAGVAGAAGAPTEICNELGPGPALDTFKACAPDFEDCALTTVTGSNPRLAATTCGVMVVYQGQDGLTVGFPERPKIAEEVFPANAAHGAAVVDTYLLAATGGDNLFVADQGGTSNKRVLSPGSNGPSDELAYRSLWATKELVAWTGRQGYPLVWQSPPAFNCQTDPATGGCTRQIAAPPSGGDPLPGWGVVGIGKVLYWSFPGGVSSVDTQTATTLGKYNIGSTAPPSTLAVVAGRPLHAQANRLTLLPASFSGGSDPASSVELAAGREIRDVVVKDNVLYVLAAETQGTVNVGSVEVSVVNFGGGAGQKLQRVVVSMAAARDPVSLAVGNDAIYFSTRDGTIHRVARKID